jgi:hypothetical protein
MKPSRYLNNTALVAALFAEALPLAGLLYLTTGCSGPGCVGLALVLFVVVLLTFAVVGVTIVAYLILTKASTGKYSVFQLCLLAVYSALLLYVGQLLFL